MRFAVFTVIFAMITAFIGDAHAQRKFTSDEAKQYVSERFIDTCAKQYMAQYDTTKLDKTKMEGFKIHADQVCVCMLGKVKKEFTFDEIADVAKSCCTTVNDLITEEKDFDYYESLQFRYLDYVYNRGYLEQCGFVLDGVDLNQPANPNERRIR